MKTGPIKTALLTVALLGALPLYGALADGQKILIDFGDSVSYRGASVTNPDSNGHYWNSVHSGLYWSNLTSSTGSATSIGFGFGTAGASDSYNGPAGITTTNRTDYTNAVIDSVALGDLGIKQAAFDYYASSTTSTTFTIQGLNPAKTYNLTFFGSHKYSTDTSTVYTVYTSNDYSTAVTSASLNVQKPGSNWLHNSNTVVTISNVSPQYANSIWIGYKGDRGNAGYLNAMSIEEVPTVITLTGSAGTHGTVSPTSTNVPAGGSASFIITADSNYRIASLTTNGTAVTGMSFDNNSTTTNFTWSNVQAAGVLAATFTAQVSAVELVLIDFGDNTSYRGVSVTNPDSNGNYWNSVDSTKYWSYLTNSAGSATSIGFGFGTAGGADSYNGPAGATSSGASYTNAVIDAAALGVFGNQAAAFDYYTSSTFTIQGLDSTKKYNLTFYGSHKYSTDDATVYTVYTSNDYLTAVTSASLNVQTPGSKWLHNSNTVVTISNVSPQYADSIWIGYKGAGGNLGYLNAMSIKTVSAPSGPAPTNGVIGILGSSVAKGWNGGGGIISGSYAGGYFGLLTPVLESRGWGVTNVSTGGDDTAKAYTNIFNKLIPASPDYAVVALSLANEGLVFSSDRAATYETFRAGLTNILHTIKTNGIQPAAVTLLYPCENYTLDMYGYVQRMNLLLNTWDMPSINLMGAINSEQGRWVYEYIYDSYHPTADGHAEMFHAVVPSLFDALAAGRTNHPALPPSSGFVRVSGSENDPAPLVFEPDYTMHAFTMNVGVRTKSTGTVAAIRSVYSEPLLLVDFGPTNDALGRATSSPDAYGNHWNNWRPAALSAGTALSNLVDTSGTATGVGIKITSAFSSASGRAGGYGLCLPEGPDPALLGTLAVETATEDYFCTTGSAELQLTGLDTNTVYTLRLFACRESSVTNLITNFTVTDKNGSTTYPMLTSGPNIGRDGAYDGNNHRIIGFQGLEPAADGSLTLSLSTTNEAFISLLELGRSTPAPTNQYGTIEVRDSGVAYVSPGGVEITAPVDALAGGFADITLSHNYALGRTYLFVDGLLYGTVGERLVPDRFVLGGPDAAAAPAAPDKVDFRSWCIYRSSWTPGEAMAQHLGAMQQASLEIAAPLDDAALVVDGNVTSVAQSMSEAFVRATNAAAGSGPVPPGALAVRSYAGDKVVLGWQNNSGGYGGAVVQRRTRGTAWMDAGSVASGVSSFTDTGLDAGQEYLYRVAARDGSFLSAFSEPVSVHTGSDGNGYENWMEQYISGGLRRWLIDFNATSSTNYGSTVWNTVSSWTDTTPRTLVDTGGVAAAHVTLTLTDPFDTARSGNGSPLADYAADAQSTLFVSEQYLNDQLGSGGAQLRLSGLKQNRNYNLTLFARCGSTTSGYDYRSRFSVESGQGVTATEIDTALNESTVMFSDLEPGANGNISLTIGPADTPNGAVFAGISMLDVSEVPRVTSNFYLIDFAYRGATYSGGTAWNSIPTNMSAGVTTSLVNKAGSAADGYSFRFDTVFNQNRAGSGGAPGGYDDVAEDTCFALGSVTTYAAKMTFGGLNTNSLYDFLFLASRPKYSGFSNVGIYTFQGSGGPHKVVVDGGNNKAYTFVGGVAPAPDGTISLSVSNAPTALTPFAVLNVLRLSERSQVAGGEAAHDPGADPDGDGTINLLEYAYGMNPLIADEIPASYRSVLSLSGPAQISLTHARYLPASDVTCTVQSRTNLLTGSWQTATGLTTTVISDDGTNQTLRVSRPLAERALFLRLKMEYAP